MVAKNEIARITQVRLFGYDLHDGAPDFENMTKDPVTRHMREDILSHEQEHADGLAD